MRSTEKKREDAKWIKEHAHDIISFIVCAVGVIATILATQISESKGFLAVYVAALVLETVALIAWLIVLYNKCYYERERELLQDSVNKEREKNAALKLEYDQLYTSSVLECANRFEENQRQMKILLLNFKNASKLNNELCNRIPGLSESSYKLLSTLEEFPQIPQESKMKAVNESKTEFIVGMLTLYKQYTSNLLTYAVTMVETYLEMFEKKRQVSATVKLFNEPYFTRSDARKSIIVYTAFRDKRTYEAKTREICQEPYSIDGNVDFSLCIRQENYYINNVVKGDPSYANEHKDFDAYYNCAAVVPIRAKLEDGSFKILGYLCCDCLNDDQSVEVFDKQIADLLFSLAQFYATFLETLDSNWSDRFSEVLDDKFESFLHMLFEHMYTGKNSSH